MVVISGIGVVRGVVLGTLRTLARDPSLVNLPDHNGQTPLIVAVMHANEANRGMVVWLIDQGADVNAAERNGYSALYWAAFDGDLEAVAALLAHGAAVDLPDAYGRTPLHRAAALESLELTALLLAHGADPKRLDLQGHTPAYYASDRGVGARIRVLLSATPAPGTPESVLGTR